MNPSPFLRALAIAALALPLIGWPPSAHAQSDNDPYILATWADTGTCDPANYVTAGCCGQPGRRPCGFIVNWNKSAGPGCLNPDANVTRQGNCNLPNPADGSPVSLGAITGASDFANFGQATFYFTSDVHYYRQGFDAAIQARAPYLFNKFAGSSTQWPTGVGIPAGTSIRPPSAVVFGGDLTLKAGGEELGAFRHFWENGSGFYSALPNGYSLNYQIFPGLGNHDTSYPQTSGLAQGMYNYIGDYVKYVNMDRSATGIYGVDEGSTVGSHNYSWDWGGVHFVQLNVWAGADDSMYSHSADGVAWLANDLAANASDGRPVILFQHYDLSSVTDGIYGWCAPNLSNNCWRPWSLWWPVNRFAQFWNAIKDYHIVALFTGHYHTANVANIDSFRFETSLGAIGSPVGMPALTDSLGQSVGFDEFRNGNVGQGETDTNSVYIPETGSLDFFAAGVTPTYLDVAKIGWKYTEGSVTSFLVAPYLDSGFSFHHGKPACRLRIDSRYLSTGGAFSVGALTNQTIPVTNASTIPISGTLALKFGHGVLSSSDFVDSCDGSYGSEYLLVNPPGGVFQPNQTMNVPVSFSGSPTIPSVVLLVPWTHQAPSVLMVGPSSITTSVVNPPPATISILAPGSTGTPSVTIAYTSSDSGWLSVQSVSPLTNGQSAASLQFTKPSNTASGHLSALVTITVGSSTATVPVNWNLAPQLTFTPASVSFVTGDQQQVTVTGPNGASVPFFISNATGLTIQPTSGNTPAVIAITGDPSQNPHGFVKFTFDASSLGFGSLESDLPLAVSFGFVNFDTAPSGGTFLLDRVKYRTPIRIPFFAGQTHILAPADDLNNGTNSILRLTSWSDGAAAVRSFVVPTSDNDRLTGNLSPYYAAIGQVDGTSSGAGSVNITPGAPRNDGFYLKGTVVQFQAVPGANSLFDSWTSGLPATPGSQPVTLNQPVVAVAKFDKAPGGPITVDTVPTGLTLLLDNTYSYTAPYTFYWAPTESHVIGIPNQPSAPHVQTVFAAWTDNANLGNARNLTGVALGGSQSFVASTKQQYEVMAAALPSNGGVFTGLGYYDAGSQASVTASATPGYTFNTFIIPRSGAATATVPVTQPTTLSASFAAGGNPLLHVTPGVPVLSSPSDLVTIPITIGNTGAFPAGDINVTVVGITASAGAVAPTLDIAAFVPQPVGSLAPGKSLSTDIPLDWPAATQRIQLAVRLSANNGAYSVSTTLNLFR